MTNGEVDGPPMSARGSEPPHTKCAAVRHTLDFNCDNVFSIRRSGVIFGVSEGGSCHCNRGRGRCDRSGQILKKSTAAGCQWPLRHQMRRGYRLPMGQEKILRSAFGLMDRADRGCSARRTAPPAAWARPRPGWSPSAPTHRLAPRPCASLPPHCQSPRGRCAHRNRPGGRGWRGLGPAAVASEAETGCRARRRRA